MDAPPPTDGPVERFWQQARKVAGLNRLDVVVGTTGRAALTPPTFAFHDEPAAADRMLAQVVAGARTATSSPLWVWEAAGEELPARGDLAIALDGQGRPAALIRQDAVTVQAFDAVPPEHAAAEGYDSLEHWRQVQRPVFTEALGAAGRAFDTGMPVVLEAFTVLHPRRRRSR